MVEVFKKNDIKVITNGTDSHIVLLQTQQTTGHNVANALEQRGIIVNKNTIPNDKRSVMQTSGIRIGTAAEVTRRGFDKQYFETIAETISTVIREGE
jgi:glycine hydroxymethyltransferase